MRVRVRDGVWWADCYYFDSEAGKRKRVQRSTGIKADGTKASENTARKAARDLESALADGRGRRVAGITLAKAFERRIAEARLRGASPSSLEITITKAAHVLEYFGEDLDVRNYPISDEALKAYAVLARAKRAPATVIREMVELRCALRAAGISPLPKIPDVGRPRAKEIWLSSEDTVLLLEHVPAEKRDHVVVYRLTGARWSELYRLCLLDINAGFLRIRGTKTEGADRTIPLHPQVREVLERRGQGLAADAPLFCDVWSHGNGNRDLSRAAVQAGLTRGGKALGVPGNRVGFNVLRASFCTELVLAGVPLKKVAYLMGHKSTQMVERVYTRFFGQDCGLDLGAVLKPL